MNQHDRIADYCKKTGKAITNGDGFRFVPMITKIATRISEMERIPCYKVKKGFIIRKDGRKLTTYFVKKINVK